MEKISAFGIQINPLSKEGFLSIIKSSLDNGDKIIQHGVNAASINQIYGDPKLQSAIRNSDLVNIDGISVVFALRFLGYKIPERVPCPDLTDGILQIAETNHNTVFLLGATEDNLLKCIDNIKLKYSNLIIAGYHNGYYSVDEEHHIVNIVNESKADILLLGMQSPKKELFIENHKDQLNIKYCLGVGGYFDILSGTTKRAPLWIQKMGLEWFFRLIQEPGRLWKRYLIGNLQFVWIVLKEKRKMFKQIKE